MKTTIIPLAFICAFQTVLFADPASEFPVAAKKLQQAYRKASEDVLAPIRERYVSELTKLSEQAMKDQKLSEAVALKQEINSITAQTMTGEWRDNPGILQINTDGTTSHSNGATGRWTINGDVMVLKWSNGVTHTFPVVLTKDILRGKIEAGPTSSVVLPRIR